MIAARISILLLFYTTTNHAFVPQYSIHRSFLRLQLSEPSDDWTISDAEQEKAELEMKARLVETTFQLGQQLQQQQQNEPPEAAPEIVIPTQGVSVSDVMEDAGRTQFDTQLVPIVGLDGVAQIATMNAGDGAFEAVRYLVNVTSPTATKVSFIMTDVPPYTDLLAATIQSYMGPFGSLEAILFTSKDAIHYDQASAIFIVRRSHLLQWKAAFENVKVIGYRIDITRDCAECVTQVLDGYGPWASESISNMTLVESGRPLTIDKWDEETTKGIIKEKKKPPDEETVEDSDDYSPEAIRAREEGKAILAVYTPGHTFGTLSYVFPYLQAVVSGYTIPIEDDRDQDSPGPALDYRGYITTSKAGMRLQTESARFLVETYSDRFKIVLPSRADPLFLGDDVNERKNILLRIVNEYDKVGKVYAQLGILSENGDGDEE